MTPSLSWHPQTRLTASLASKLMRLFYTFVIKVFHLPCTFFLPTSRDDEPSAMSFVTTRQDTQSISYGHKWYFVVTRSLSSFRTDRSLRLNKKRPSFSTQSTTAPLFPRKISNVTFALDCNSATQRC